MKTITVELFANITNSVVLRTPGREFPGVLIQGDSLHILYGLAEDLRDQTNDSSNEDLRDTAAELADLLSGYTKVYETALKEHSIPLPYPHKL